VSVLLQAGNSIPEEVSTAADFPNSNVDGERQLICSSHQGSWGYLGRCRSRIADSRIGACRGALGE
jgi:hypothetical protein